MFADMEVVALKSVIDKFWHRKKQAHWMKDYEKFMLAKEQLKLKNQIEEPGDAEQVKKIWNIHSTRPMSAPPSRWRQRVKHWDIYASSRPENPTKTLWIFWGQGWENAPRLAHLCCEQWQKMNPGWEIRQLDKASASEAADLDLDACLQKFSWVSTADILRIALLKKHGGVWTDSTVWCMRPLDEWLNMMMIAGFFAFSNIFNVDDERLLRIWFVAAQPDNQLIHEVHQKVQEWTASETASSKHYFWAQYLIEYLYHHNDRVRHVWDLMPKMPIDLNGFVNAHLFETDSSKLVWTIIQNQSLPMIKFSSRRMRKWPENFANTACAKLLGRESLS